MEWVYAEIPSRVIPHFLTEDNWLRATIPVEELGVYAIRIKGELEENGYTVTLNEDPVLRSDVMLIDFKP